MLAVRDSHAPPALPERHSNLGANGHGSMALRGPVAEGVEEDEDRPSALLEGKRRSKKKNKNRVEAELSASPTAADVDNLFAELSLGDGMMSSSQQNTSGGGGQVVPQPPPLPPQGAAGPRLRTPPSSHTPRALLAGEDDSALGSHDSRTLQIQEGMDELTMLKAQVVNAHSSALGSIKLPYGNQQQLKGEAPDNSISQ